MPELTPLSDNRKEHFLNGEVLEPLQTRREYYYAGREDELPPHQPTREELFIQKYRGGGGDVTVVPLSVTENGTYSEEGKAYSPVEVNVPLPQNAYLLKSVANLPQAIATFNDGANLPMPTLKVAIEPQQDLHGYDAPWVGGAGKNKCDITGGTVTSQTTLGRVTLPAGTYVASATVKNNTSISGSIKINAPSTLATGNIPASPGTTRVETNSFTISEPTELIFLVSGNASGYNYEISEIQIEIGSTATSFAPYSNICPIIGWNEVDINVSGVNVWDEEWELGLINVDTGQNQDYPSTIRSKNYISVTPNTTFYMNNYQYIIGTFYYRADKSYIGFQAMSNNGVFTTPNNCYFIRFRTLSTYGTTYNNDISINYPSTDTSYHAYNGHAYTIDLDGTRYGGTLDVVSGVLTVDSVMFALNGSENWTTDIVGNNKRRFTCISLIDLGVTTTTTFDAISNIYVNTKSSNYTNLSEVFILRYLSQYNQNRIDIMTEAYQDVASFKAFLNSTNMQIVYELATPLTIQLTPTAVKSLLGQNNVWADTGDIKDAEYFSKEV